LNILYTLGAKFGGTGIGRTAEKSVAQVSKEHNLKVAAYGFDDNVANDFAQININRPFRWPFSNKKQYRLKRAKAFDNAVANLIENDTNILHSWNGHCLESLKKARQLGMTTIVTRASSHMLTQMKLIEEEFERYGISRDVELQTMIDRCVEEYEYADYIQVPSEFVKDSFLKRSFPAEKLIYSPFGVDFAKYRQSDGIQKGFKILFVGRIGLRKGCQYLLEAYKRLDLEGAELVLLGNIEPGFEKVLAKYRNLKGFNLPGFVKDPAELYASSSVFVFPSIEEGSALVTYEAMASGLPLVTTFNSGSLVRDGVDGYIVPIRDVDGICEKIQILYNDKNMAKEMGNKGREFISEYSWERYGRTIAGYYRKIEENRNAART